MRDLRAVDRDQASWACAGLRLSRLHHKRVDGDGGTLLKEIDGNEELVPASVLDDDTFQARQRPCSNADLCSSWQARLSADGQARCNEALDLPQIMQQLLYVDHGQSMQDAFGLQGLLAMLLRTANEDVAGKQGQPRDQLASGRGAMHTLDKRAIESDSSFKQPIH